ncbi:unnamed protein product [Rotaria sp. Silwood2]|nr:unnamed protein product [Rotaria sp. Silwood2]CAF4725209.1 unnamed protein product [Rotaria sp. Silwood2]
MNSSPGNLLTLFENLPNEVIYEIFEYLDFNDIDQIFSKLNLRYHSLVNNPAFHIKINISSMSKNTFESYCKHILIPYQNRIYSMNIENLFIFYLSSPLLTLSQYSQLEILILKNIESNHITSLLPHLSLLPNLSSLIIIPIDDFHNVNRLYHTIFRLPALKYLRISLNESDSDELLPIAKNHCNPIEHFVIDSNCSITHLKVYLSYLSQLRRLSCKKLLESSHVEQNLGHLILSNLTHLSLQSENISFNQIKLFIRNLSHQLQVFRFSTEFNITYLNANQWQELILSHMPYLRIFDIELQANYYNNKDDFHILISQFMSPFWYERQWFFTYEYTDSLARFYSTEPYRRKHCTLHNGLCQHTTYLCRKTNYVRSVEHISIRDNLEIENNLIYFPNTNQLTLFDHSNNTLYSIPTILDRTIPLVKLFKLCINCHQFCIGKLMELLYFSPNVHILIINSISLTKISSTSIQQTQTFQTIHKINKITILMIREISIQECLLLFIKLCPRLKQFTVQIPLNIFISIISHLFFEFEKYNEHLSLVCLLNIDTALERMILPYLPTSCSIKSLLQNLYIW